MKDHLILELGMETPRLVKANKIQADECDVFHGFRIEAMGASEYCLDGFDFDRQALKALVDDAQSVLFVVHADSGNEGATMATFAAEYAVSQRISVDVLLSRPYSWEGRRRTKAANTLAENLSAVGANVTVVDAEQLETTEFDSATQALAALDVAMVQEMNRWVASAK